MLKVLEKNKIIMIEKKKKNKKILMKSQMIEKKEKGEKLLNKCVHFSPGHVQIVIIVMLKIIFQDIDAIVADLKNQATQIWRCLILVENIVKKKDMRHVLILDVSFYAIQEAALLVQLKFLFHVLVEKSNKEFNVKILRNINSIVKILVVNF